MISVDEGILDALTETFHLLRTGKTPPPIPIPDDLPDNELRQALTYVNRFLLEFSPFADALARIARGDLATQPVPGRMGVVSSFKSLQANLRHLTWKTQQIAGGDLNQRVDFMGDFSTAFNSMTQQLKESYERLIELNEELESRNRFIRKTFGRYTGDEIVDVLLDMPDGLELGGEKREITLLMSDLRGFTALVELLEPTEVVRMLNHYLTAMVEVIRKNGGIIDEIIGDAILALFGAPVPMEDAALRAALCALEMQKAMREVNEYVCLRGWPELEMGIALHTGEVVVGNIGSSARSKYAVVGQAVNLTARIESFTVGGQSLASPALVQAAGPGLVLGDLVEIHAKGMKEVLQCREVLGHEDHPRLAMEKQDASCVLLAEPALMRYVRMTDKHLDEREQSAILVGLSRRRGVIEARGPLRRYENIMLRPVLDGDHGEEATECYAKVIQVLDQGQNRYLVHFTTVSPGMRALLHRLAP